MVLQHQGKQLGIIGTGLIGREVAAMGKGLGLQVVAWSFHPDQKLAASLGLRHIDLPELLRTADIVSLHLRATRLASSLRLQLQWISLINKEAV